METLGESMRWLFHASGDVLVSAIVLLELFAFVSAPSVLLRRRGRPLSALAWLLALFALPGLGGFAWWAIGRTTLERRRRKRVEKKRDFARRQGFSAHDAGTSFDDYFPPRARGEDTFSTAGSSVKLLADGRRYFPELREALRAAKFSIHIEMYIFELDPTGVQILEILQERAAHGVDIRLLLDGFGSQSTARRILKRLERTNIRVALFLPSRLFPLHSPRLNFINHRKIVIIDERIAFTGGMNIGQDYEMHWRDLMLKLEGPAVRSLHHILLDDWYFATDETTREPATPESRSPGVDVAVVASGPDTEAWIHDAYFLAITEARTRLTIVTPYFIPSLSLVTAMRTAAGRGVDVRVVLPSRSDVTLVKWASRSYYRDLISAGVRIFEYGGAMLHAKALIQDERLVSVGTANVDTRSMGLSFEVTCFLTDEAIFAELSAWIAALIEESVEIDSLQLDQKGTFQKLAESAAHLLSPIL